MAKRIGTILIVLLGLAVVSCGVSTGNPQVGGQSSFGPVRVSLGDDASWSDPLLDDSRWRTIDIPETIDLRGSDGYFWIRTSVAIPDAMAGRPVWLESGKIDCAFDLYAGGAYIGSRGGLPPRYNARPQIDTVLLIPSTAIADGRADLAFRCYYSGTQARIPGFGLADAERADMITHLMAFFISRVNVIIAVLCIFMGCYFIAGFISRPDDTASLYYALSLFLVAVYFLDMGSERVMIGGLLQRAVARECLSASMAFSLLFFVKFFGARGYKAAKIFAAADIVAFAIAYLVFAQDDGVVNLLFNLSLAPVFGIIVIVFAIVAKASRDGRKDAVPILVGLIVGLGFAFHDIAYQVTGRQPFAWLQGFTFFSLNLSVFVSMSLRSSLMRRELDEYTREVSEQRDKLSKLLCEAERAADETSTVARMFDDEVSAVAEAALRSAESAEGIGASAEAQRLTLEGASASIGSLLESIAAVRSELALEAASIERTTRNTGGLIDGVTRVGDAIDGTAAFASSLDKLTSSSLEAMARLSSSMERVRDSSKEIRAVVVAVNEFADQTNLLAMNASIEAAHAGSAGKGFAVIAHEIKRLAQASSERSARIGDIVAGIESSVGEGVVASASVSESLASISEGAAQTSARVSEAAAEAARQRKSGEGIAAESRSLASSAVKIMEEAAKQSELSESASSGMRGLQASQVEVAGSAARIVERNAELADRAASLRSLAARARKAADDLVAAMSR
ncbi:MAG: hypothetical protein KKA67_15365 [Spirochaetes bacterium]|nr:hypothetical protein [Spirochaetota bacterium]MBU1080538.1 hypothetical protein [Spirochaetota bacterium]